MIKGIYENPTANNILYSQWLKDFPLGWEKRQKCSHSQSLRNTTKILARAIRSNTYKVISFVPLFIYSYVPKQKAEWN